MDEGYGFARRQGQSVAKYELDLGSRRCPISGSIFMLVQMQKKK